MHPCPPPPPPSNNFFPLILDLGTEVWIDARHNRCHSPPRPIRACRPPQVPFHRHYEVLGTDVLLPPGRMVKFIDMGSYRTRHHPNPTAKAVLTLSYYFTMWVTDQQLDPEARELWYWSQRPDVVDLPPLQALRKFAAHFVGRFPQFAGSPRAKWRGVRNVRHYRVPSAAEAREVATTYHNVYDYHWQVMPVSTT